MYIYIYTFIRRSHHTPSIPARLFPTSCGLGGPNNNSLTWAVFAEL